MNNMVDGISGAPRRIGGLASGMDIDSIVEDLMSAERIPLDKLQQDKTIMEWQRDAYRDINKLMLELDEQVLGMKLEKTYASKIATSSQSDAISATAGSSAQNGTYSMKVNHLATNAINVTQGTISDPNGEKIDPLAPLSEQTGKIGTLPTLPATVSFKTYHNGEETHEIEITEDDSMNDILTKITNQDNGVRAFYDVQEDIVVMERTSTGDYNSGTGVDGPEIDFSSDISNFFKNVFKMDNANEQGGTDAEFVYNNAVTLTSKTNTTTLNGITFNFTDTMDKAANISVSNNVDNAFDNIMKFVDKYNEVLEKVNGKLTEERYRDFPPLTDQQRKEMSDSEIELWEEKAQSGMLKGDNILSGGLFDMRQNWYAQVKNDSDFSHLSEIGIETSKNYLDGGKLIVNEDELKAALREDPASVHKMFSNDVKGDGRGIINRLEDSIDNTMSRIEGRAGKSTSTLEQYTLGKRLKDMDDRIDAFEDRLASVENRYWNQFTAMEKAIQRMNEQSAYLMQQFNGQ